MGFAMPKTCRDRDTYEVLSSLHKSLRRGLEEDAMMFALELWQTDAERGTKNFKSMVLNYLVTVAYEDIGPAAPDTILFVVTTVNVCREFLKAGKADYCLDPLAVCIQVMCRSRKSRAGCEMDALCLDRLKRNDVPPIPDYALDMHTRRGRAMKRSARHFNEVAGLLSNEDPHNPYKERAADMWERQYGEKPPAGGPTGFEDDAGDDGRGVPKASFAKPGPVDDKKLFDSQEKGWKAGG